MRFIKKVGKLAKFVIYSQDVREARPQSALLAATREGNLVSPPSHVLTLNNLAGPLHFIGPIVANALGYWLHELVKERLQQVAIALRQ